MKIGMGAYGQKKTPLRGQRKKDTSNKNGGRDSSGGLRSGAHGHIDLTSDNDDS